MAQLEAHHKATVKRLLHSLDQFQHYIQTWQHLDNLDVGAVVNTAAEVEAGVAADSIFSYLNKFIDDIGRVIPYVFEATPTGIDSFSGPDGIKKLIQGQGKAKDRVRNADGAAYNGIRNLFDALDDTSAWWSMGFRRGHGIRQKQVHFTDLMIFTGRRPLGIAEISTQAHLGELIDVNQRKDFIDSVRTILLGLCEWLDSLEYELRNTLEGRAAAEKVTLPQYEDLHRFMVPVKLPMQESIEIPESDYLYLPIREGSDSLKMLVKPSKLLAKHKLI